MRGTLHSHLKYISLLSLSDVLDDLIMYYLILYLLSHMYRFRQSKIYVKHVCADQVATFGSH